MMSSYKEHLDIKGFDDDEDLSDDEVFTRTGKTSSLEENGVNKPLMAPRQRSKDGVKTKVRKVPPIRVIWAPTVYILITLSTIIGIVCLVAFLINVLMRNVMKTSGPASAIKKEKWLPCSKISTEDVWIKTFPKLTTETAIRLNDVNADGIDDIIFGFGTGADAFYYPPVVCRVYFPDAQEGCGGGVMALDGNTGAEIWRHYTPHEIFALNCNVDIDEDSVKDCICAGRMAGFMALSGKDGYLLWNFDDAYAAVETSNVYTPQFVSDMDFDGVPDLVVVHGGDPMKKPGSKTRLIGRIMIVSGKTGQVLKWVQVPDGKESYYSPQVIIHPDGTEIVLFGTGGETHGGSLWYIELKHLARGEIKKAKSMYTDTQKGIMTPPVLIDITGDGISDIVMAMFNSSIIAFDGLTFSRIWEHRRISSESYSTPGVGYFNDDDIPDFIINYQVGPGFPIYYYTETTVLDGRNGKPLLSKPIKMVVGTQSSPLVISEEGYGNDLFLYWVSDCHGSPNNSQLEFDFAKGTSVHDQSRADFCKLRFKEALYTRLYALSSHMTSPGVVIYDSDDRKEVEYSNPINYSALGREFLYRHPEFRQEYERYSGNYPTYDYQDAGDNDLVSHYDDYRYQGALSDQGDNRPSMGNSPPLDQNDYSVDDRGDAPLYPSPYNSQNLGNQLYSAPEYYQRNSPYNPKYRTVQKNLWPKKKTDWSVNLPRMNPRFYERYHSGQNNGLRNGDGRLNRQKKEVVTKNIPPSPNFTASDLKQEKKVQVRHVGPHDGGGIQRVISTGTLAPALKTKGKSGIDIVFATFWFYPSSIQSLMPEDKQCIESRMQQEGQRFKPSNQYFGLDHDAYEETVTKECLRRSGRLKNEEHPNEYNPFNRQMGQVTVYRIHINCHCAVNITKGQHCSKILPFNQQGWPSYMGRFANSATIPRG